MSKLSKEDLRDAVVDGLKDFITGGREKVAEAPSAYPQPVERVIIETDNELVEQVTPFLQHKLGLRYRDKVSGFVGVADSVHIYLNGCERYSLQGAVTTDGKIPGFLFDGNTLELLVPEAQQEPVPAGTNRGGPPSTSPLDTHEDVR